MTDCISPNFKRLRFYHGDESTTSFGSSGSGWSNYKLLANPARYWNLGSQMQHWIVILAICWRRLLICSWRSLFSFGKLLSYLLRFCLHNDALSERVVVVLLDVTDCVKEPSIAVERHQIVKVTVLGALNVAMRWLILHIIDSLLLIPAKSCINLL